MTIMRQGDERESFLSFGRLFPMNIFRKRAKLLLHKEKNAGATLKNKKLIQVQQKSYVYNIPGKELLTQLFRGLFFLDGRTDLFDLDAEVGILVDDLHRVF